ncbi:DNRLRE domain-containing protein [Peribacillus alkalitolerans]|uniref:DNRLRE domain-containing protein n=1 Tax=Peribacillus alkalitolerans TaxID=1550385 RepID=UPI0013D7309F|nr:DNRLRE domain-containing protein [Peribacillus alkalitolerans]
MRKFTIRKSVVWVLAIMLVFTSIPFNQLAYAEDETTSSPSVIKEETVKVISEEEGGEKKEIIEERTDTSKVFDNGDGTFTKNIYFEPVHLEEDGEWKEISPELQTANLGNQQVIETEKTTLESTFLKKMQNGEYATFQKDTDSITFSILEASGGQQSVAVQDVEPEYQNNEIIHKNIFPNIDLRNFTFNENVKEDLVLHSYQGLNTFTFKLSTSLHAKKEEDGSVSFFKQNEDKKVFALPKPFMTDSNIDPQSSEAVRSEAVDYHIEELPNQEGYLLTVTADEEWLSSPERKFPIYIDPTTSVATSTDAFVMSAYPTTNYGTPTKKWDSGLNQYVLKVGLYDSTTGTNYAYLKQDISKIENAIIDKAILNVHVTHSYYPTTPTGLWIDEVTGSWDASTLTWNNKPNSTNIEKQDVVKDEWAYFTVTNTVKAWAAGTKVNNGFKLHTNGNGQTYWKKVISSDNTTNKPYLSVWYHYDAPETPTVSAVSNGPGTGTGYLNVNWKKVTGAEKYKVQIFNGKDYESILVNGDVNSWTSKGKKLWPTQAQIDAGEYKLRADQSGTEFAFNPNPVYQNAAADGGTYGTRRNYAVRVIAVFPGGDSPWSTPVVGYMPMEQPTQLTGRPYSNAIHEESGYVNLNWHEVEGADGYYITMYNGTAYERVGKVEDGQTTWTTQNKGIWPTELQIAAGGYALNTDGAGRELALDPSPVYKNSGGIYPTRKNYWFRVQAYSNAGHPDSQVSEAFMPTIPGPEVFLGMEDYWSGIEVNGGTVNAATGNLMVSETDISIDGRGPGLSIGRTYNSQSSIKGIFGMGWISDAESKMITSGNQVDYTDDDGTIHSFIKQADGSFNAPTGVYLDLKETSTDYVLTSKDQTSVYFDKATGVLKEIIDAQKDKNKTVYNYTENRLSSIVDASGRSLTIEYNPEGLVSNIKDPKGRNTTFTYKNERLETVTNPEGEVTKYEYDTNGLLVKVYSPTHTSEKPVVTTYKYKADKKFESVTNPKGKVTTFTYFVTNRTLVITNPKGNQTFIQYNAAANLVRQIDAYVPGNVDPNNNLETQYEYLGNNLVKSWDPKDIGKGATESYEYDQNGNVKNATDSYGTEVYEYNSNNDVTQVTDTEGDITNIAYDGLNPISETDDAGAVSSIAKYDDFGNEIESSSSLAVGHNLAGNPSFETNLDGWNVSLVKDTGSVTQVALPSSDIKGLGGKQAIRITTNSSSTANEIGYAGVTREINVEPDKTYTVSAKIKSLDLKNANAFINVQLLNGSSHVSWADHRYSALTGTQTWSKRQVTFKTGSNVNKIKLYLEVDHRNPSSSGEAWFDEIQVEQSDVSSSFNPYVNSSFEDGVTGWVKSSGLGEVDVTGGFNETSALKMTRTLTSQSAIQYRQTIDLNQEEAAPVTITGLSKSENVKNTVDNGPNKDYSLWAKVVYIDGTFEDKQALFPLGTQDWNRSAVYLNSDKAIKSIDTYVLFRNNNTGTVWFDGIRLVEGNILEKTVYDEKKNYAEGITDVLGRKSTKSFDEIGNLISEINPRGFQKTFNYDLNNQLKSLVLPNNSVVNYVYDKNGNNKVKTIESSVDNKKQEFHYEYDEDDKLISVTNPLNQKTINKYDDNDNLEEILLPNGNIIKNSYDGADRVEQVFYNNAPVYKFIKDKNGNETEITDFLNQIKKIINFDEKNRVTSQILKKNDIQIGSSSWTYPLKSDKLESVMFTHGGVSQTVDYEYDKLDQNTLIKNGINTFRMDYDELGNVHTYTPPNGVGTSYIYDRAGQVTSQSTGKVDSTTGQINPIINERYVYDANGNRKEIKYEDGTSTNYTYDDLDQLRVETLPDGTTNEFNYDGFGNRNYIKLGNAPAIQPMYNLANQLTTFGEESIQYDENGNRIADSKYTYEWNAADQLIAVYKKGETSPYAEYKYDDNGRRIQKNVQGTITNFIYDGDSLNVLYETNENEQVLRSYVYGVDGQLLALNKYNGSAVSGTYYYHYNPRGDVIALTDHNGSIVGTYKYDSWGNPLNSEDLTGVALENPYRYAGYQYDEETGLYYLMARYYHPIHGVFLSLDPDPGDDDDILTQNGYAYANNNPVMMIDPDGLKSKKYKNKFIELKYKPKAPISRGEILWGPGSVSKLAKGAQKHIIYLRTDLKSGRKYIGRTIRSLKRRGKEHEEANNRKYRMEPLLTAKNKRQARRYEQKMINRYKKFEELENKRNEISKRKWKKWNI